jgi:hypothetical protein
LDHWPLGCAVGKQLANQRVTTIDVGSGIRHHGVGGVALFFPRTQQRCRFRLHQATGTTPVNLYRPPDDTKNVRVPALADWGDGAPIACGGGSGVVDPRSFARILRP